jgi:hypothetical protein
MRPSRGSPGAEPSVTTPQRARQRLMELMRGAEGRSAKTLGNRRSIVQIGTRVHGGNPMAHVRPAEAIACPCDTVVACDQRQRVSACPGIRSQQQLHTGV